MFCHEAGIIDKRGAKLANIDRVFIAVDQDTEGIENNEKRSFTRAEFMESLVRLADFKYKSQGRCETVPQAI